MINGTEKLNALVNRQYDVSGVAAGSRKLNISGNISPVILTIDFFLTVFATGKISEDENSGIFSETSDSRICQNIFSFKLFPSNP